MDKSTKIYSHPAELLSTLIRFNTTNPPGNERLCIEYINKIFQTAGLETTIFAKSPDRPNLITRLRGAGNAPPLLLYGHVDVVTTENQNWTQPPFGGLESDGYIWGRGALDMKHGIAMFIAALLKAKDEALALPGDIIFAATVDEEAGSEYGAKFLVEEHSDLFKGIQYGLSEFGGFNMTISGKRFSLIQIAEKQICPTRVVFRGPGGHAANRVQGSAITKLAAAILSLDRHLLPVHLTQPVRYMLNRISTGLGGISGAILNQLTHPLMANFILRIMGKNGVTFSPLLHNTVTPTILKGSDKRNVIPSEVSIELDGRLLPGFTAADLKNELRSILGEDCSIDAYLPDPGTATIDMGIFDILAKSLGEFDPVCLPVPYVNPAITDARFFSRLGIQTYGFTPLFLPDDFNFISTIHAADERIPIAALEFGTRVVYHALQRIGA